MDQFMVGVIGSVMLVAGSALPDGDPAKPRSSLKNWLFALGGAVMFVYALMGYLAGGNPFFVILQSFIVLASILMMAGVPDKYSSVLLIVIGAGLVGLSLMLFEDYTTIVFTLGLIGIGLGYVFDALTLRRSIALLLGAGIIAVFSYIKQDIVYMALNSVFALFSAYYVARGLFKPKAAKGVRKRAKA